jgi:hypothetical protein
MTVSRLLPSAQVVTVTVESELYLKNGRDAALIIYEAKMVVCFDARKTSWC